MIGFKENIPLADYTVFKIGGPARYFCEVKDQKEIIEALNWARTKNIPFFILGAGSNILISDNGFPGLVIKMGLQELRTKSNFESSRTSIVADAGVSMARAVNFSIENNLRGFEWGIGIPGTIGGSVFGNAGCYGGEMKDIVESVDVLIMQNSMRTLRNVSPSKMLNNEDCEFRYRNSIFKSHSEWIILGATLNLKKGDPVESRAKILEFTKKRSQTQDIGEKCAGCIFKNPKPGLSAGSLIDSAGLKGKRIGGAVVSEKHANYIINTESATAYDVQNLIRFIKSEVQRVRGVTLEEEIRVI